MSGFIASGRVLDVIIALTVLEALGLIAWHRRTGRGLPARDVLLHLAAGTCLAGAFRLHTLGAGWPWVALCLAGAGLTHLADTIRRWNR